MSETALDWDDLFARYEAMAVAFARGLTGDAETARDLFQEAARATYERAQSGETVFENARHARNYLFRALRNLAADAHERRRRGPVSLGEEPAASGGSTADRVAARESADRRSEALRAAFATLPASEQEALSLRYLQGLAYKDVAARTGLSISTLQARVEAGLDRLRNRVGKSGAEE